MTAVSEAVVPSACAEAREPRQGDQESVVDGAGVEK